MSNENYIPKPLGQTDVKEGSVYVVTVNDKSYEIQCFYDGPNELFKLEYNWDYNRTELMNSESFMICIFPEDEFHWETGELLFPKGTNKYTL